MANEWNPDDYERHSSAQKKWGGALIEKLQLKGDEHLLDIGCGDGLLTIEIAARLPRGKVTGIDRSEAMIEHAKTKYPRPEYPNCSFECMDAESITYESMFDIAFSNAALHWVPEQDQVLEGVFRALKPGGRLLFQMGGQGNAAETFELAYSVMEEAKWRDYFTGFSPGWRFRSTDEYEKLLKEAGFKSIRVELIPVDMVHNNRDGLEGWIRTTWHPFMERLPDHLKEEFITIIADRYLKEHPPDSEGKTHVKMVRLEAEAIKV